MKKLLKSFINAIPDATLVCDLSGSILCANLAAHELLRYPDQAINGIMIEDLVPERYRHSHKDKRESFMLTAESRRMGEMKYFPTRCFDGHEVMTEISIGYLNPTGNEEPLLVVTLINRTEQVNHEAELRRLANTDSLTGLCNRRHFYELAEKETSRSIRQHKPLTVITFDLDHFKSINDTYGHAVGDELLMHIGALCRAQLRDIDIVGRMGGEEFAAVLPDTDATNGLAVAERLRQSIMNLQISSGDNGTIAATASFGMVAFNESGMEVDAKSLEKLLRLADKALYQAKETGRNRTCVEDC